MHGFAAHGLSGELATIFVTGALAGVLGVLYPLATGFLFESVVPRAETGQMFAIIGGLALAAIGSVAFNLTKAIALLRMESRTEAAMQPALMHRLMALPVNFFRGFGTGDLTNRVLSIQTMRRLLANNTLVALISGLFATISFAVILVYSPLLAAVAGALVTAAAAVSALLAIGELRQQRRRATLRGQEDGLVLQIIQAIGKIRVAASESRAFAVWAGLFSRQQRCFRIGQRYMLIGETFGEVFPVLALLGLFFVASRLLSSDAAPGGVAVPSASGLSLGTFLAINAAFGQLLAATISLARSAATALEIVPLFERLRPLLTAEPESRSDKAQADRLSGRIDVSHVTFRYPGAIQPVLDDVSLSIEPGSFVAFVGPSGSGKSTLLRLLLGFETAESGDVLYDDQSIGTLDTASLRRQIGVVLQSGRIATGSIFDNLTNGLPYKHEDAWEAARLAGIAEDIEAMAMAMHTLLIEGSSTLSGGQRQRLMIARALIGRPRILLFDEATSALDNQSQALVMQSLERLSTTRIVIAHRLSTVERADRIFVLEGGRLVESGNFAELMARDGMFKPSGAAPAPLIGEQSDAQGTLHSRPSQRQRCRMAGAPRHAAEAHRRRSHRPRGKRGRSLVHHPRRRVAGDGRSRQRGGAAQRRGDRRRDCVRRFRAAVGHGRSRGRCRRSQPRQDDAAAAPLNTDPGFRGALLQGARRVPRRSPARHHAAVRLWRCRRPRFRRAARGRARHQPARLGVAGRRPFRQAVTDTYR